MAMVKSGYDAQQVDDKRWCSYVRGWIPISCVHETKYWVPIRCGKCEGCRNIRRAVWVARIMAGIVQWNAWKPAFLTLTTLPGTSWPRIMRAWQHLIRFIREEHGFKLPYVVVKEVGHSTGMRHLHAIIPQWVWIDAGALRRRWTELLQAPVELRIEIKRVKYSEDAAHYVVKYITKGFGGSEADEDTGVIFDERKRISMSQGWPKVAKQVFTVESTQWSTAPRAEQPRALISGTVVDMATYHDPKCSCVGDLWPLVYLEKEGKGGVVGYPLNAVERDDGILYLR